MMMTMTMTTTKPRIMTVTPLALECWLYTNRGSSNPMALPTSYTEETCENAVIYTVDHVYWCSISLLTRCKILEIFNLLFSLLLLFHLWAGLIDKLYLHQTFDGTRGTMVLSPLTPRVNTSMPLTFFSQCYIPDFNNLFASKSSL